MINIDPTRPHLLSQMKKLHFSDADDTINENSINGGVEQYFVI